MVALLIGLSGVHAQDRPATPVQAQGGGGVQLAPGGGGTRAAAPADAEIGGVQARAVVTPEEQLEQAERITRRANQLAERLARLLDESRREKDIMRANCVNRKLTEVHANTRNIDQRNRALRDAVSTGDDARRGHEFTVLTVLAQKLESLDKEATQCLGQSLYESGARDVTTTIQRGSPTLDPTVIEPSTAAPPSVTVPPPNLVPEETSPAS